ncbi:hypothetical protein OGAPHI_003378 [Ogataea philodendri]|uniref:Uncharacterized protein n=1 Tax=Ogataea philodendri TaxID=1378263 RepID=A0A9P8P7E2_9ASCO|nr:uncharacterized protein OGAPHI_003378 [Ogataea philodendri]KAH3666928.1 hypothetical protein OGAPHI_003378 [Ogataea philodendri]
MNREAWNTDPGDGCGPNCTIWRNETPVCGNWAYLFSFNSPVNRSLPSISRPRTFRLPSIVLETTVKLSSVISSSWLPTRTSNSNSMNGSQKNNRRLSASNVFCEALSEISIGDVVVLSCSLALALFLDSES